MLRCGNKTSIRHPEPYTPNSKAQTLNPRPHHRHHEHKLRARSLTINHNTGAYQQLLHKPENILIPRTKK